MALGTSLAYSDVEALIQYGLVGPSGYGISVDRKTINFRFWSGWAFGACCSLATASAMVAPAYPSFPPEISRDTCRANLRGRRWSLDLCARSIHTTEQVGSRFHSYIFSSNVYPLEGTRALLSRLLSRSPWHPRAILALDDLMGARCIRSCHLPEKDCPQQRSVSSRIATVLRE